MPSKTLVVAIVGVDGCGKSSAFRGALDLLAPRIDVVGIGDEVLAGHPGEPPHERRDLRLSRATTFVSRSAKRTRRPWLYRQLKSLDLIGRSRMRDDVVRSEAPAALITDGDPLVNTISWAAASLYREDLAGDDERLFDSLRYLAGERRIPVDEMPYYLRTAWQLLALNRLSIARFGIPDVVVHLRLDGAAAMARIRRRGRALQRHETEAFLDELGRGYERVCDLVEARCSTHVIRLQADRSSREEIVRTVTDAVLERVAVAAPSWLPSDDPTPGAIEVVATTMSGSLADQRKIGRIGPTMNGATTRPVRVHEVDSHAEARDVTHDVVARGGRVIVSAGGAGTFNAVLEGAHVDEGVPADLRLAFLRKGSADLIGKMLRIPDDLPGAVAAISDGIERDRRVTADILSVESQDGLGQQDSRHFVGFAGLGVFGEVPRFTESRFVKLYKGILSTLFGDYGPFFVGLALATAWWFIERARGRVPEMLLELDGERIGPAAWSTIIVVNGDLGTAFPLGRGLSFSSGTFRVVALRDVGWRRAFGQLAAARTGRVLDAPERYACIVREVSSFVVRPVERTPGPVDVRPSMVNVDGLLMPGHGAVRFGLSGRVELIAGPSPAQSVRGR